MPTVEGPIDVPRLSLAERDGRWARVRAAMREAGLDCLVLPQDTGYWGQYQADAQYVSHLGAFEGEVAVVFPLEGPVTAFVQSDQYLTFWQDCQDWVDDVRSVRQLWSKGIIGRIQELGLGNARIGVSGLGGLVYAAEGFVTHTLMTALEEQLPRATFTNATPLMQRVRAVKSPEEVDALRRSLAIAEQALVDGAAVAAPGTPDRVVYGEIVGSMVKNGGWLTTLLVWLGAPDNARHYHYPSNRPMQAGEMISVGIEGNYAGYRGQIIQSIAIGGIRDPYPALQDASAGAFNHLAPLMKPGVSFGELYDACAEYERGVDYKIDFYVQARGIGDDWPLVLGPLDPGVYEARLEEGYTIVLKPKASVRDRPRVAVNWGDMVVVTPEGGVRLGTRRQELLAGPVEARADVR